MAIQPVLYDSMAQRHVAMASGNALLSQDQGNALATGTDGGLYMAGASGGVQDLISKQPGNYARLGNDGGVYIDGNDILANGVAGNLLHIDPLDKKVILTKEDIENAIGGGGGGSDLKPDVDQLKVDVREIRTDVNTISRQVEKNTEAITDLKEVKTDVTALRRDVDTNTRDIATIKTDLADIPAMKRDIATNQTNIRDLRNDLDNLVIVSTDRNNVLEVGRDGGAYLDASDITIDIRDLVNTNDPLLTERNGKLVSNLSLQYNPVTGRIDVLGVHGQSIASAVIPTAVTMLKSVTIVENPVGQPAGTYILFQFAMQDGSTSNVYLNVNKLVAFYTAGDGINISTDGVISVDQERVAAIVDDAIEDGDINLLSTDRGNLLTKGRDNKPYLSADDLPSGISSDAGNALTLGSDDKPFFPLDYGTL